MITIATTQLVIKLVLLFCILYSIAAIMFGEEGAAVSRVMERWGQDYPGLIVVMAAAMSGLFFHFFKI